MVTQQEGRIERHASLLITQLIWPAAAGNVAWAAATVALQQHLAGPDAQARFALLILLAIYLAANWLRTEAIKYASPFSYLVSDFVRIVTVVILAITASSVDADLKGSLARVLWVAVVGHAVGVWMQRDEAQPKFIQRWKETIGRRFLLSAASGVGLLVLHSLPPLSIVSAEWVPALALGMVLIVWGGCRYGLARKGLTI